MNTKTTSLLEIARITIICIYICVCAYVLYICFNTVCLHDEDDLHACIMYIIWMHACKHRGIYVYTYIHRGDLYY